MCVKKVYCVWTPAKHRIGERASINVFAKRDFHGNIMFIVDAAVCPQEFVRDPGRSEEVDQAHEVSVRVADSVVTQILGTCSCHPI